MGEDTPLSQLTSKKKRTIVSSSPKSPILVSPVSMDELETIEGTYTSKFHFLVEEKRPKVVADQCNILEIGFIKSRSFKYLTFF